MKKETNRNQFSRGEGGGEDGNLTKGRTTLQRKRTDRVKKGGSHREGIQTG